MYPSTCIHWGVVDIGDCDVSRLHIAVQVAIVHGKAYGSNSGRWTVARVCVCHRSQRGLILSRSGATRKGQGSARCIPIASDAVLIHERKDIFPLT